MQESKEVINRPALGCIARLGDLYDARTDTFLNISIFRKQPPQNCISSNDSHTTDMKFLTSDTFEEKMREYNLTAGITLKMLSGVLGNVEGAGSYLKQNKAENKAAKSTLMYSVTTKCEKLEIFDDQLQTCVSENALLTAFDKEHGGISATHVVARIDWGAKVLATIEEHSSGSKDSEKTSGELKAELGDLFAKLGLANADANAHFGQRNEMKIDEKFKQYSLQLYGDILPKGSTVQFNGWDKFQELMRNFSSLLQDCNDGKGKPISYGLIPISLIQAHFNLPKSSCNWNPIDQDLVASLVTLFDRIENLKIELATLMQEIIHYKYCLTDEDVRKGDEINDDFLQRGLNLKSDLKRALLEIQAGTADNQVLSDIREKYSVLKCPVFAATESYVKSRGGEVGHKISMAKMLESNKVRYLRRGESIDTATLAADGAERSYALFAGKDVPVVERSELFNQNLRFFIQLVKSCLQSHHHGSDQPEFIFVDCKIHNTSLSKGGDHVAVHFYRKGNLESEDLWKDCKDIPITGTYVLESNGNYGELLTAIGTGYVKYYAILGSYSTVTISESNGRYSIKIETTVGTVGTTFKLNEEYGEFTADGYNAKSIVTREGNSLVQIQHLTNAPKDQNPRRTTIRTFTKTEMKVDLTANGVRATRVYVRQ